MTAPVPPTGVPGPLDWRKQFLERQFHDFLASNRSENSVEKLWRYPTGELVGKDVLSTFFLLQEVDQVSSRVLR